MAASLVDVRWIPMADTPSVAPTLVSHQCDEAQICAMCSSFVELLGTPSFEL